MNAPMIFLAVGIASGILAACKEFGFGPAGVIAAGAVAAAAAAVLCRRAGRSAGAAVAVRVMFALAGTLLGLLCGARHYRSFPPDHVRNVVGEDRQFALVEGTIVDEPVSRSYQYLHWTALRLAAEAITIRGVRRPATGLIAAFVTTDEDPPARYGQRVRLGGMIGRPEPPMNPGEADRRAGYAHERIHAVLSVPKLANFQVLEPCARSRVFAALFALKDRMRAGLRALAPPDVAAFLDAILLGRREALDPALVDDFVKTSTVHVLAISGMHLAILGSVVLGVLTRLFRLPTKVALGIVLAFAVGHCALTGAAPSIVRATIMLTIVALGRIFAREPRTLNSLAVAAVAILVWCPGDLMNVGFQLSFAAVLGIELLFTPMRASFVRLFPPLGARAGRGRRAAFFAAWIAGDAVLVAIAAWLATAPLIVWHFHLVSPGTVVANLAVAAPAWIVLSIGTLGVVAAPAWPLAAKPLVWLAGLASLALIGIVRWVAAQPGVYFYVPDVHAARVVLSYAALGALVWAGHRRWRPRWVVGVAPLAAAVALAPLGAERIPAGEARVAVLAVGKGATAIARTSGATVLFDCGSGRIVDPGKRYVAPYLWSKGIRRIDAIFLSHAHDDHTNALVEVLDRFSVGRVYGNAGFDAVPGGRRLLAILRARGVPFARIGAGDRVAPVPGMEIAALAPVPGALHAAGERPPGSGGAGGTEARSRRDPRDANEKKDDQNDRSLVLKVALGGHTILFPGDLEDAGSSALLAATPREALGADVLLVPHHGSRNRRTEDLAQRVRPRLAIASTKEHFAPQETFFAYEDLGSPVAETWATGCIELLLRPGSLVAAGFAGGLPEIPPERPPPPPLKGWVEIMTPVDWPAAPPDDLGVEEAPAERAPARSRRRQASFGVDEEARARRSVPVEVAVEPPKDDVASLTRAADEVALAASHARAAVGSARPAGAVEGPRQGTLPARLPRARRGAAVDPREVARAAIEDDIEIAAAHARAAVLACPTELRRGARRHDVGHERL